MKTKHSHRIVGLKSFLKVTALQQFGKCLLDERYEQARDAKVLIMPFLKQRQERVASSARNEEEGSLSAVNRRRVTQRYAATRPVLLNNHKIGCGGMGVSPALFLLGVVL